MVFNVLSTRVGTYGTCVMMIVVVVEVLYGQAPKKPSSGLQDGLLHAGVLPDVHAGFRRTMTERVDTQQWLNGEHLRGVS